MRSALVLLCLALLSAAAPAVAATGVDLPREGTSVRFGGRDTILINAMINGHGPYTVIFDTGANTIVSEALAGELGLTTSAGEKLNAFAGAVDSGKAVVSRFQIGGLTLTNLPVHVVPFPYSLTHISRRPIVAAIGADLLPLFAIRIDNTKRTLGFYPSASFVPPRGAAAVPLHLGEDGFSIDARLDGQPGRFGVDTGQDVSLDLYSQAVKDRDLVARYHAVSGVTGQGFGGQTHGWFARAPSLEVGGVTVHGLMTKLSGDAAGIGAGAATGNLGMGFFKRFTVSLDAARQHAWFEPNAALHAPDPFNRAGLQLEEQADGAHVMAVLPASPAAKAGLKVGDVIQRAGRRTPDEGEAFDGVFLQKPGTAVALKVRNRARPVRLVLRDVL